MTTEAWSPWRRNGGRRDDGAHRGVAEVTTEAWSPWRRRVANVTTARIEAWLRTVRSARRTAGGLCRRTADESLESEQTIMKLQPNDDDQH